jgi:hypothetical protein
VTKKKGEGGDGREERKGNPEEGSYQLALRRTRLDNPSHGIYSEGSCN